MTLAEDPFSDMLDGVASENVTPSGGAVTALVGAAGASLCEMVCIHTVAREDGETDLEAVGERLQSHRRRLLGLADEDAAAVERVQSAFRSSGTEREDVPSREAALTQATDLPLETASVCLAVLEEARAVTENGTATAAADALTGLFLAHAALRAAVWTARANLALLDDDAVVSERAERLSDLEAAGQAAFDRASTAARERCQPP